MRRIVVTGAECTGKTTLVRVLADHYAAVMVPEAARLYVQRTGRGVDPSDVEAIVALFTDLSDRAEKDAGGLILYDTDLYSTVAYARHYFGSCPAWIEHEADRRVGDLYVLAGSNIPWQPEASQRGSSADRDAVQELLRTTLYRTGRPLVPVSGPLSNRVEIACEAVDRVLAGSNAGGD